MERLIDSKPRVCFEFEVEKVLGVSSDGNYQVQWAPAWVSKFHLVGCEHLIHEFLQQQSESNVGIEEDSELPLPNVLHAMMDSEECKQQLLQQQSEIIVKVEPEVQGEIPYSYEAEMNNLPMQDSLESLSHSQLELKPDSEILLNIPDDSFNEEEDHFEEVQRNITMELHESNDRTALQPLNQETDPPNTTELADVSESSDSNGVNNLLVVQNVKHEDDHELRYLTNEKPSQFICTICHNKFSSGHDLEKHVAVHFNEAETSGTGTSSQKSNHNAQMGTHTSAKLFSCNQCGYSCRRKGDLAKHLRTHTGEKPFSCNQCNYSGRTKSNLTQHILIHTGEKPYSCQYCGKSFAQKHRSISHMRTHTGDKPFSCEICGRKFTRADQRNRHTSLCLDIAIQTGGSHETQNLR